MERKQLESAAARNYYLRGLLAIPFGLLLVFSGLGNMEWGPFRHLWVLPVSVLLAGGAYALLMRYYNDNYGRVTPKLSPRTIGGTILSILVMGGGPMVVQILDLPFNGIAVSWSVVALAFYAVAVGLRAHHVVIWGSVLVASVVPVWGDPRTTDTLNVGLLIVGVAAMAAGVFDHRLLVRSLGPAKERNRESDSVGA